MMAVDLHCVEELLFRSLFLADNNNNEEEEAVDSIILSNTNGSTHRANDFDVLNNNGIELSTLGSSSASSSEQASSTAETETDEDDDYIAELTRQMAHYMFQEDDKMDKVVLACMVNYSCSWGLLTRIIKKVFLVIFSHGNCAQTMEHQNGLLRNQYRRQTCLLVMKL